jgi:hypothetical protein
VRFRIRAEAARFRRATPKEFKTKDASRSLYNDGKSLGFKKAKGKKAATSFLPLGRGRDENGLLMIPELFIDLA